jgi:hypothetical protein
VSYGCEVCRTVRAESIPVVKNYKVSINPISDPDSVYSNLNSDNITRLQTFDPKMHWISTLPFTVTNALTFPWD